MALMAATDVLRAEWCLGRPTSKIRGSHNPVSKRSSSHVIRPCEGMFSQRVSLQPMLLSFAVSFLLSISLRTLVVQQFTQYHFLL